MLGQTWGYTWAPDIMLFEGSLVLSVLLDVFLIFPAILTLSAPQTLSLQTCPSSQTLGVMPVVPGQEALGRGQGSFHSVAPIFQIGPAGQVWVYSARIYVKSGL